MNQTTSETASSINIRVIGPNESVDLMNYSTSSNGETGDLLMDINEKLKQSMDTGLMLLTAQLTPHRIIDVDFTLSDLCAHSVYKDQIAGIQDEGDFLLLTLASKVRGA